MVMTAHAMDIYNAITIEYYLLCAVLLDIVRYFGYGQSEESVYIFVVLLFFLHDVGIGILL